VAVTQHNFLEFLELQIQAVEQVAVEMAVMEQQVVLVLLL
jgi:hypothetical protein